MKPKTGYPVGWVGGGGAELFACPYPLKVQAHPPQDQRLATQTRRGCWQLKVQARSPWDQTLATQSRFSGEIYTMPPKKPALKQTAYRCLTPDCRTVCICQFGISCAYRGKASLDPFLPASLKCVQWFVSHLCAGDDLRKTDRLLQSPDANRCEDYG